MAGRETSGEVEAPAFRLREEVTLFQRLSEAVVL